MINNQTDSRDAVKRLNVLIALQLINMSKKKIEMDFRGQIQFLLNFGFKNNEIAEILGKSANYINKEMHFIRKSVLKK